MPTPTYTKNFKSLTTLDEVKETLDSVFNDLFDILKTNPNIVSLLDPKGEVPSTKAGDLVSDLRDDTPKLKWADGKNNLVPFGLSSLTGEISDAQHGHRASYIEDPPGTVLFQMHDDATPTRPGFLSAADKTKLDSAITAVPYGGAGDPVDANNGIAGVSTNVSRADHTHKVKTGSPVAIGAANADGTSTDLARADHVHNHGNQNDPNHHAVAVAGGNAGFLSGADKSLIDLLNKFVGTKNNGTPTPTTTEFNGNGAWGWFLPSTGGVQICYNVGGTVFARDLI